MQSVLDLFQNVWIDAGRNVQMPGGSILANDLEIGWAREAPANQRGKGDPRYTVGVGSEPTKLVWPRGVETGGLEVIYEKQDSAPLASHSHDPFSFRPSYLRIDIN